MSAPAPYPIRKARAADVPRIRAIVDAAYGKYVERMGKKPGPMLDDYDRQVRDGTVWVLEADGAVAGLVVLLSEPDHVLLDNVAVDPASAGRGIGRALIAFAEAETRRRGFREIRLYTNEKMTENIAMYPKLGYEETHRGEQAGYRRVFMRKKLGG